MNFVTEAIRNGNLNEMMDHMHHQHSMQDHIDLNNVVVSDMGEVHEGGGNSGDFCHGMGMIMYMDGFQWTFKRQSSCLNFYFPSWTLDSQTKFILAMVCVILMGVFTEAIGRLRHDINKKARRITSTRQLNRLWYLQTCLQGINAFMAYVLMLATMTYSLEILGCVILGLMIGYFVFGGDLYNHAGSVCCQFLEDEEEDPTVGTMTGAILRTLASNDEHDGDHDNGDGQREGYRSPSAAGVTRRAEDSCCNETHNDDEANPLHTRLLSDVA